MAVSPFQQEELVSLLNKFIFQLRSIDDLLRHAKFRELLRRICARFNFKPFNGVYDSEDLYQDSCVKFEKSARLLQAQGRALSEEEFSKWLFVLVHNVLCSKDRQLNKLRRHGLRRSAELVEKFDIPAQAVDLDAKYILSLFLEFTKDDPEESRRFIDLWLSGCSLREIEESLKQEGGKASYGKVRNVLNARIKAFKESLGLPTPELRARQVRKR